MKDTPKSDKKGPDINKLASRLLSKMEILKKIIDFSFSKKFYK